jgi:nucleotide-binding universal stress UspA family protein
VQHAAALATEREAVVILLRVVTVVPSDDYFFQRIQLEEGSKGAQKKAEAEDHVTSLGEELRSQGVDAESLVLVSEKAEDEAIVEYAMQSDCDLIVLPNLQRSLISRWLQGNVVAKVQRRSRIPILLISDEV